MNRDIRDTINRAAYETSRLRSDGDRHLREWIASCSGMTMNHLALYEAKNNVDRAYEAIGKIKADLDYACALADEAAA